MSKLSFEEKISFLKVQLKAEKKINEELKSEVVVLYNEIERLKRNIYIENILNGFKTNAFKAAAGNLLIDPNPIELSCSGTKADTTEIYSIRLLDVLAICSRKRPKDIYLRNTISSNSGGPKRNKITFDKNEVNFDQLLTKIQGKGTHLLRVHNKYAINIYHYSYSKKNTFILNTGLCNDENRDIHEIPTDAALDIQLYNRRIFEIGKLSESQIGVQLNFDKIAEINALKENLDFT
jgi:hypothetical protein